MKDKTVKQWFEAAVSNPDDKAFHVQLGCHLEEVCEMLEVIGSENSLAVGMLENAYAALKDLSDSLKAGDFSVHVDDRKELLDSICDQQVTGIGVAHMLGMDIDGAMNEVNKSNWSKFVGGKPLFSEQGKIAKGPDYKAPELERFV